MTIRKALRKKKERDLALAAEEDKKVAEFAEAYLSKQPKTQPAATKPKPVAKKTAKTKRKAKTP